MMLFRSWPTVHLRHSVQSFISYNQRGYSEHVPTGPNDQEIPQTNPCHHEKETQNNNNHTTARIQLKSIPLHDCKTKKTWADLEGDRGSGPPLENHKNIEFLRNTGQDPIENHKATKTTFIVGSGVTMTKKVAYFIGYMVTKVLH